MNLLEQKMIDILTDLKENHHVVGVKAEFAAEGSTLEEVYKLKEIVTKANLDLTIKIGGCEAFKDMYDARKIGVTSIVAPMIESPYAAKKYLQATQAIFSEEERKQMNFFINIETKYGFEYLEEILSSDFAKNLTGIVIGRTDLTASLGLSEEDINNDVIFDYVNKIAKLTLKYNKELVIGGGVSVLSLPFFKNVPSKALNRFETRKIIFDAQKILKDDNAEEGILKAISFELMWIKNKQNFGTAISIEDNKRIEILKSRYKDLDKLFY